MPEKVLLLFIDGFGISEGDLNKSVYADYPNILNLLQNHTVPIDPCMGVPGIPQSATGQTAIFTGKNSAELLGGKHKEGFPNKKLRELLENENIFTMLRDCGKKAVFANAYVMKHVIKIPVSMRSVTTVSGMSVNMSFFNIWDLISGKAVFHDITRRTLPFRGIYGVPLRTPGDAAKDLLNVLDKVDFCLFEYFLTDRAGHRRVKEDVETVLSELDEFLGSLIDNMNFKDSLLLLTSDHGNIEDQTVKKHTLNPVPWCAVGAGADQALSGMNTIMQITPKVLSLLK